MKKTYKLLTILALSTIFSSGADAASKLAGQTVKIGVLTDMSGTFADLGGPDGVKAVQMAVDDFVAKNKPEFKIEVISADHQNKVDIASAKAQEWFDRDGVDVIAEMINSGAAIAVSDIADKKKKVVLVTGAGSNKITNENCKTNTIHYAYDTYALANVAAKAISKAGGKKWFIITNNYAFGQALETETAKIVKDNGGEVVGIVRHPFDTTDFSSYLLQAKDSGADVIGLANAGGGVINAVKQANEFGITKNQKVVGLLTEIQDVNSLGLQAAQGMLFTAGFVWNRTPETTEWSRRFFEKTKKMPSMIHAGDYSSVMHYLDAVKATDSKDADVVVKQMKETPVNDFFAKNTKIREDGLLPHEMYLVKVKTPAESKEPWDYFNIVETVPGDQAYEALSTTRCPLLMKK
jgi:branched-chain amino acid transport system substrate-binding protein